MIRHSWSIAPQPDLAAFALAPVSDALERAQAAQRLTEANPDHVESRLLLARTALEAGLTGEARRHAEAAVATGVNQRRLWLLLAEIEEAEGGDTEAGRLAQRDALRRAATAEPDPVWRCDACHTAHAVMASELSGLLHRRQPALEHGTGGDSARVAAGPRSDAPDQQRLNRVSGARRSAASAVSCRRPRSCPRACVGAAVAERHAKVWRGIDRPPARIISK